MLDAQCSEPLTVATLLLYWLDMSSTEPEVSSIEEHLFGCEACSESLAQLASLGERIRRVLRAGDVAAVLPTSFVRRMEAGGLKVREYRLEPQGSVNCTVTPDDDLVLAHLQAPLQGIRRLDAVFADVTVGKEFRLTDIAFNVADGEVVFLPNTSQLRPLERATQRVDLISVEETGERTIGSYLFHHRSSI